MTQPTVRLSVLLASIALILVVPATAQQEGGGLPVPVACNDAPMTLSLGPGCGAPAPQLTISAPAIGDTISIVLTSAFPDTHAFVLASAPAASAFEIVPGCTIYLDLATTAVMFDAFTDNNGDIVVGIPLANDPTLSGFELNLQALVWAPGGVQGLDHISNGVAIRTGCCDGCDGKVSQITLQYVGPVDNANIEVKQANNQIIFNAVVPTGGLIDLIGTDNGTFGNELKVRINGGPELKIHTSCSKPIGPGLRFGDFNVVQGTSLNGGPLCPLSGCDRGKPCRLIMRYVGSDCSATTHTQDPSKVSCSGDPAQAPTVFIRATEKSNPNDTGGKVWFEGDVDLGDAFSVEAGAAGESKLKSTTFIHIFHPSGALLQSVEFHTSCSQPLNIFDQFGSVRLEQFFVEGECSASPSGSVNECGSGIKPAVLTMQYTGESCMATNTTQDPSKVSCSGDPAMAPVVVVRASDSDDPNDSGAKVWFQGTVNLNDTFLISAANEGLTKLTNETHVHVFAADGTTLLQQVEFHTSCSQPLGIGDQFGSLLLTGFVAE